MRNGGRKGCGAMERSRSRGEAGTSSGPANASGGGGGAAAGNFNDSYDYLFKFLVIGSAGTGKSCLLHQFIEGRFKEDSSHTIGVEFGSKIVPVGGKTVKLQVRTANQPIELDSCNFVFETVSSDLNDHFTTDLGHSRSRAVSVSHEELLQRSGG